MKDPVCEGKGGWTEGIDRWNTWWDSCPHCDGTGVIGIRKWLSYWFWNTVPVEFVEWYADIIWKNTE